MVSMKRVRMLLTSTNYNEDFAQTGSTSPMLHGTCFMQAQQRPTRVKRPSWGGYGIRTLVLAGYQTRQCSGRQTGHGPHGRSSLVDTVVK